MLFLRLKSQFLKAIETIKEAIRRNGLIIKATTVAFFIILSIAIIATVIIVYAVPELSDNLSFSAQSMFNYNDVPIPYSGTFLSFIFMNNIGHFWNPIRMIVWIPFLGPLLLGLEVLINGGVIGVIATLSGVNRGVAYPIIALVPHGIIEIPAFLLQLSAIVLWQATITEAILAKLRGRQIEKDKTKQGLWDALILALTSIILLFIAAAIETYVTPYLLGM